MDFDTLFTQWQKEYPFKAFICDGIVDAEHYESPHILFILREMNRQTPGDLCWELRNNGSGWKTWNNIGRWTKALLDGCEEYPRDMSQSKRKEQLRRIAVMNIKKEGGGKRSNGKELLDAVRSQKEQIETEIFLCNPDIIICCGLPSAGIEGTAKLLKEDVFSASSLWEGLSSETFGREWQYYNADIYGKQVPVIAYCHPQVTNLEGNRGHEKLFMPLYRDMLLIRKLFLSTKIGK